MGSGASRANADVRERLRQARRYHKFAEECEKWLKDGDSKQALKCLAHTAEHRQLSMEHVRAQEDKVFATIKPGSAIGLEAGSEAMSGAADVARGGAAVAEMAGAAADVTGIAGAAGAVGGALMKAGGGAMAKAAEKEKARQSRVLSDEELQFLEVLEALGELLLQLSMLKAFSGDNFAGAGLVVQKARVLLKQCDMYYKHNRCTLWKKPVKPDPENVIFDNSSKLPATNEQ